MVLLLREWYLVKEFDLSFEKRAEERFQTGRDPDHRKGYPNYLKVCPQWQTPPLRKMTNRAVPLAPSTSSRPSSRKTTAPASSAAASTRASRPSPTATCTSAMPSPFASTSASPRSTAASATSASTTPTPPRRK